MFYKYEVTYWFDDNLADSCGIVFGKSVIDATEHLSYWYGRIANLTLDAIDLDTTCPVLDFNSDYKTLEAAVEAVEK